MCDLWLIRRKLLARVENHVRKSRDFGVEPPNLAEWFRKVLDVCRSGFRCEYCAVGL